MVSIVLQFFTPFKPFGSYHGVSTFASSIVGTVLGTYLANFVLKSGKIVDEKSESITELISGTIEKGKEMLDDITTKEEPEAVIEEPKKEETPKEEKSARERLKDKGLM